MDTVKKPFYKYCLVPNCISTTVRTPKKIFFHMPCKIEQRKKWCAAMKRDLLRTKSRGYVCEDHFDIEHDTANLMKCKLVGGRLKLKPDVYPHKFNCPIIKKVKRGKKRKLDSFEDKLKDDVLMILSSQSKTDSISTDVEIKDLKDCLVNIIDKPKKRLRCNEVKKKVTRKNMMTVAESTDAAASVKVEIELEPLSPVAVEQNEAEVPQAPAAPQDWQQRELQLLKKIEELEQLNNVKSEDGLKQLLKVREDEIDLLKARVRNLETEVHAALSKPGGKNQEMIENIKHQHEELLSKAKGMIFDKTKMVKNQELQIEALTTQVQSLKDINQITKDLLEIRNSEVKAMEERFQAMDARFKAEKERYSLVLQRAQTSTTINDDLRKEYETQLAIFKELREKYEQKVQALVAENERLKASAQGGASG